MKKVLQIKPGISISSILLLSCLLLVGLSLESIAADKASSSPAQKIVVAYSSISGNNAPLWVTQEKGFFRKYGLDVQTVLIESGTTAVQSLISGEVNFAHMAGAAGMQNNLPG